MSEFDDVVASPIDPLKGLLDCCKEAGISYESLRTIITQEWPQFGTGHLPPLRSWQDALKALHVITKRGFDTGALFPASIRVFALSCFDENPPAPPVPAHSPSVGPVRTPVVVIDAPPSSSPAVEIPPSSIGRVSPPPLPTSRSAGVSLEQVLHLLERQSAQIAALNARLTSTAPPERPSVAPLPDITQLRRPDFLPMCTSAAAYRAFIDGCRSLVAVSSDAQLLFDIFLEPLLQNSYQSEDNVVPGLLRTLASSYLHGREQLPQGTQLPDRCRFVRKLYELTPTDSEANLEYNAVKSCVKTALLSTPAFSTTPGSRPTRGPGGPASTAEKPRTQSRGRAVSPAGGPGGRRQPSPKGGK